MKKITVNIDRGIFNPAFLPFLNNFKNRFELFYGGAGSGKSVFVAQRKIIHHLEMRGRKTLVIRKVGRTNRHSTFAELKSVISNWNLSKIFKINKSDLEIHNVANGNQFIFTGLDDVDKLKSIQGITDVWIEESSEISEDDFKQINLRLRGVNRPHKQITLTFNPISALSWIKSYFFDRELSNCLVFKTTYKDNHFLTQEDVAEIERLKDVDPVYWRIYGLGEWGVLGSLVYTNYKIEKFEAYDEDEWALGRQYNGVDWGFNDPAGFLKIGFRDGVIYVADEFYAKGLDNSELMQEGKAFFDKRAYIKADSAEPARIKEWRKNGFKIAGAKKGRDSIRFGIDFLRRHKIIIHPRCQNFINEIQGYCYRQDKEGNVLEEPVDFKNHLMDAIRYALEDLAHERKIKWVA